MSKIQRRPVRSQKTEAIPLERSPDKPAVLVRRQRRPETSVDAVAASEGPSRARKKAPPPPPSPPPVRENVGGRPRTLEEPCKVLVTLEGCDVKALECWRKRRGYPHRSAALRAMIAEVCRG